MKQSNIIMIIMLLSVSFLQDITTKNNVDTRETWFFSPDSAKLYVKEFNRFADNSTPELEYFKGEKPLSRENVKNINKQEYLTARDIKKIVDLEEEMDNLEKEKSTIRKEMGKTLFSDVPKAEKRYNQYLNAINEKNKQINKKIELILNQKYLDENTNNTSILDDLKNLGENDKKAWIEGELYDSQLSAFDKWDRNWEKAMLDQWGRNWDTQKWADEQ